MDKQAIYDKVAEHYSAHASGSQAGAYGQSVAKSFGYTEEELTGIPQESNLGLSCGNPLAITSLTEGETIIDLGSGAGFDIFLASKRVGATGRAIGVDMNRDMLALAAKNKAKAGTSADNVSFVDSQITDIALEDGIADCIISNCVINLVPEGDKHLVFKEMARLLKPGGRVAISDILAKKPLAGVLRDCMALYAGCIGGASQVSQYEEYLQAAGFTGILLTDTESDLNVYIDTLPDGSMRTRKPQGAGTLSSCCPPQPAAKSCCSSQPAEKPCCAKEKLDSGCCKNGKAENGCCGTEEKPRLDETSIEEANELLRTMDLNGWDPTRYMPSKARHASQSSQGYDYAQHRTVPFPASDNQQHQRWDFAGGNQSLSLFEEGSPPSPSSSLGQKLQTRLLPSHKESPLYQTPSNTSSVASTDFSKNTPAASWSSSSSSSPRISSQAGQTRSKEIMLAIAMMVAGFDIEVLGCARKDREDGKVGEERKTSEECSQLCHDVARWGFEGRDEEDGNEGEG
ncbi:uncharacterized protein MKZ38_007358 [Zalerion maritima]|uniref:Arsenite methyltransferase n=1 Tax=Zalerion maritima TaxID=339359 RepID=A0AAD5WU90_9PEZI|nr:uncharacterized protein MKZ38_007358 [Zalerion maritima]